MVEILRQPVTDASAWRSADLERDRSWVHTFTDAELAELDTALEAARGSGLAMAAVTAADFPLPGLAPRLTQVAWELDEGRGCALLKGLDPARYDEDSLKLLYWGLISHLGTAIPQNARGDLVGHVRDGGRDYMSKNVRGYTTRAQLKPHCDPTDVVGLLCVHPAKTGGASLISSGAAIYNEILARHPEFLKPLCEGFHFDLRGEGVTGDPDEVTFNKVPVFSYFAGKLSCRFNQKTIEDGQAKAGAPLSGLALEAVRTVGELALRDGIRYDMDFEPGDIQLLSNHMVLHSRDAFEDWPEPERKRNLLRIWLNLHDARPLAPEFADRLNTGPRGGVHVTA